MALMCGGVRHRELLLFYRLAQATNVFSTEQKAHHNLKRDLKPNWVPSACRLTSCSMNTALRF